MVEKIIELVRHGIALAAPTVITAIVGILIFLALVCILKIFVPEEKEEELKGPTSWM